MAMEAETTNISIWTLFMVSSMQAALHMDPSHTENLDVFKTSELRLLNACSILQER